MDDEQRCQDLFANKGVTKHCTSRNICTGQKYNNNVLRYLKVMRRIGLNLWLDLNDNAAAIIKINRQPCCPYGSPK